MTVAHSSGESVPVTVVTGGAGKTCAAHLIRSVLEEGLGKRYGLITTRHVYLNDQIRPPLPWLHWRERLEDTLQEMVQAGCDGVILTLLPEALHSSMLTGLDPQRVVFTGGVGRMSSSTLQDFLTRWGDQCVCNLDDATLRQGVENSGGVRLTYAERRGEADLNARNLRLRADHIEFEALTDQAICRMRLPIPGGFGLYNALAALSCGLNEGLSLETMSHILPHTRGVPGRMELLRLPWNVGVLIDSAATPEQVDNLLMAASGLGEKRKILVLGAAGDRDRSRRPLLGEAASRADVVILTADDPRTEPVADICAQIQAGMSRQALVQPDRTEAITQALDLARSGDLVILSGRGDRREMRMATGSIPLDEREIVARYVSHRGNEKEQKEIGRREAFEGAKDEVFD